MVVDNYFFFFFSSRRRHTRCGRDWSSDVCSSDLGQQRAGKADEGAWAGEAVGRCHRRDPITGDRDRVVLEHARAVEDPIRGEDVPVAESWPCGLACGGPGGNDSLIWPQ